MPTTNLEDLDFSKEEGKITPAEPDGAELSTHVDWDSDVSGEILTTDKKLPRLNIGQKSGAIGEAKGFGNLILNREAVILPFGQILTSVTVIKIKKQWQEKREYDPSSTVLPRVFNTGREAMEAGFSLEYGDEKSAVPIAHMLLFIPAPLEVDPEIIERDFFYSFGNRSYAAGIFTATGSSWHEAARPVLTALDVPKTKELGLRFVRWTISVIRRQNTRNSWFALKMVAGGYNQPDFVNYTKTALP